jgi:hypothetical protein
LKHLHLSLNLYLPPKHIAPGYSDKQNLVESPAFLSSYPASYLYGFIPSTTAGLLTQYEMQKQTHKQNSKTTKKILLEKLGLFKLLAFLMLFLQIKPWNTLHFHSCIQ